MTFLEHCRKSKPQGFQVTKDLGFYGTKLYGPNKVRMGKWLDIGDLSRLELMGR